MRAICTTTVYQSGLTIRIIIGLLHPCAKNSEANNQYISMNELVFPSIEQTSDQEGREKENSDSMILYGWPQLLLGTHYRATGLFIFIN